MLKAIKGTTLPSARLCLARTPHAREYSLATRIEVEAHGEVLVIIDGDFGLCLGRLDCRAHAAPAMSLPLTWSACNYLARSPGKRIAEFAARVTAGDQQRRLEVRVVSDLRDWEMLAALFQREDEGVIFHSVVGAASPPAEPWGMSEPSLARAWQVVRRSARCTRRPRPHTQSSVRAVARHCNAASCTTM